MRNKRETDISQYKKDVQQNELSEKADGGVKRFFRGFGKFLITVCSVCLVALLITGISLAVYIFTIASEPTGIDLKAKSMNQTSRIYIQNEDTKEFKEYQKLYDTENRIWVDNQDIPQAMKDAVVAIEDKRFFDHNGVDWGRTLSAVANLATGSDSYGGSTITQQLIKNITDDNEVSITRKLREITKALKLEQEYTKDQILEAYLNVVNFGNNCQGVESAAQLYFGKSIKDCSIAECAAIAGITQNPSRWNPLVFPENNKERREIVLNEMYDQKKITKDEFDAAMKESATMKFVGWQASDDDDDDDEDEHEHHHHHHDGEECDDPECECHHHHHHHADDVFSSWGKETPKKFSKEALEDMLHKLDSGDYGHILRAKGIVNGEDGWLEFDYVPEEHEVRAGHPDYTGRLCVIGAELKEDGLAELFGV